MTFLHISYGGPDRVIVDEKGKRWNFEMHPHSGPAVIGSQGQILDTQPGPKHSFWKVVSLWAQQGQKIDDKGICIWVKSPEPKLIHLGGRHYRAVYE